MKKQQLNEDLTYDDAFDLIRYRRQNKHHAKGTIWQLILQWMNDHNFIEIGRGGFGVVFQNDDKIVVKVFIDDPYYVSYVNLCRKYYKSNPHFPRISRIYFFGKNSGVVFLERLTPFTDGKLALLMRDCCENFIDIKNNREPIPNFVQKTIDKSLSPTLIDALNIIAEQFKNEIDVIDIYRNNIMCRGQTIVITDPVA